MVSGTVSGFDRCARAQSELCRRIGDPPRLSREGKLELTEVLRSSTAAEGIPDGFRSDESGRVAPRGKEATSTRASSSLLEDLAAWTWRTRGLESLVGE
jgi:hypothetical protein